MNKALTFLAMPILSASVLVGCGGSGGSSSSPTSTVDSCTKLNSATFDCKTMLNGVVQQQVKPRVDDLVAKVSALNTTTIAYCAALPNSANERQAAQDAWAETMTVWQQLEVMQFGPVGSVRDEFYNWPLNDTCKVDDEVVKAIAVGYDITSGVTPARRGLTGLEYLLFNEELAVTCIADTNKSEALTKWDNEKSNDDKRADRCDYAKDISADLVVRAQALKTSLASYDVASLSNSLQASANLISDALFYIDKKTKDDKLGDVLPTKADDTLKASNLEFKFADFNRAAIHNNLKGAQAIINGGTDNAQGLSLYLKAANQEQLATDMATTLTTAINASSETAITQSVRTIITGADAAACFGADDESSELNKLCTLDNKIKDFTDHLKGRFVMTLGFTTPKEAEGDND